MKKILVLSANPKDTARLRLDEEVREIEEGLRRSKYREQFLIRSKWSIRIRDLRRTLLDEEPQIVHFCGHAEEEGLIVENENGNRILINPEALAGLFEQFKHHVECVLLNACYSKIQAEAIHEHINYVIGMSKSIQDKAAIEFVVGFYDALGAGKSIEEAFAFGCNGIQLYDIPQNLAPLFLKKKSTIQTQFVSEVKTSNLNQGSRREVKGRNFEPKILIVDDDLSVKSELYKQIQSLFAGRANLQLLSDAKEANIILSQQKNILGCITDIVFRKYSQLAGVQVAEAAIQQNIPVIVITGHKKQNIGLALDELKRIGLTEEKILTKPITFKQYKEFLEQIKGWILGINM